MLKHRELWRRRPAFLVPNNDKERRVSRLDLFFDLIFVVIFRQLFKLITDDFGLWVIWEYTLYFIPLWTIWQAMVFYTQRFEDNSIRHRWYMFVIIGLLTFAATTIHSDLIYHFELFITAYILIKWILAYMIYTAVCQNCKVKKNILIQKWILNLLTWLHIWTALLRSSLYFFPEAWWAIVFVSLAAEIAVFFFSVSSKRNTLPSFHLGHLLERYGLLLMVALAELIYAIVDGASAATTYSFTLLATEVALLGITFGIRWMYYDQITYRELLPNKQSLMYWSYLHLPLTYVIVLFGWIALYIMSTSFMESSVFILRQMFTICVASILIIIWVLSSFHNKKSLIDDIIFPDSINKRFLISKIIGALMTFVILYVTRNQPMQTFLVLQLVLLWVLNFEWVWYWIQWKISINKTQEEELLDTIKS